MRCCRLTMFTICQSKTPSSLLLLTLGLEWTWFGLVWQFVSFGFGVHFGLFWDILFWRILNTWTQARIWLLKVRNFNVRKVIIRFVLCLTGQHMCSRRRIYIYGVLVNHPGKVHKLGWFDLWVHFFKGELEGTK